MTCKQLYGPCDTLIHGQTAEEMMENSKKHAMEMAAIGDEVHINAIKAMGESHKQMDEEAVKNNGWKSFKTTSMRIQKIS